MHHALSTLDLGLLVLAGIGGGLAGSIAGLASLVSYPALLAVGLAPVTANVSNTVALVFNSVGSTWSSRPELRGQHQRALRLSAIGVSGGVLGAALLLLTPSDTFAKVVPWLVALGSIAILVRPRRSAVTSAAADEIAAPAITSATTGSPTLTPRLTPTLTRTASRKPNWGLTAGIFGIGIYAGYFGAAAGVLALALLLVGTSDSIYRANALKNVILGLSNGVAALAFVLFGPVRWLAVMPLAVGCLIGGWLGPRLIRHIPPRPLRLMIAVAGLVLAVHLGISAYW